MIRSGRQVRPLAGAVLGFCLICLAPASAALAQASVPDSTAAGWTPIADLVVIGEAAAAAPAGRITVPTPEIQVRDPGSLADVGGLLPSARVAVNSRGETYLMIRGAPERHVQTFLDGIPLNLPWDERVDLASVPITGDIRLEGRRGLSSLLEGPGALAGSVRILPPVADRRQHARTAASLGQYGATRFATGARTVSGAWNLLGAGGWQNRDAVPLPGGHPSAALDEERANSDLDQYSLLLRASRPAGELGRLNLLATGWHEKKGVPPELNLGEEARFWRYPVRRRGLMGASLQLPVGHEGRWDLSAMAAADYFDQEIDPRGPDGWGGPLLDGQDYEQNFDRTGHAMLGVTHWLSDAARLTLQGNARYAHHRESLAVGGGVLAYAQWTTAMVLEAEVHPAPGWILRSGVGLDGTSTPETGDKPGREADTAEALNLHLQRRLGRETEVFIALSRRSRFPSLRELYSGALGKFVPNPGLKPERQDLAEIGLTTAGPRWELTTACFLQKLAGGIEKQKIPGTDGQFMRVNRTDIRIPGWEAAATWRPLGNLAFTAQHTILIARVKTDDRFDSPAEDRPDYLSRLGIRWGAGAGPDALLEAAVTGPRWSADSSGASDATGGLRRLPAGVTWNLRLAYGWDQDGRNVEVHVRADNLFDQFVEYQVGLPEPGRILSGGLALGF